MYPIRRRTPNSHRLSSMGRTLSPLVPQSRVSGRRTEIHIPMQLSLIRLKNPCYRLTGLWGISARAHTQFSWMTV